MSKSRLIYFIQLLLLGNILGAVVGCSLLLKLNPRKGHSGASVTDCDLDSTLCVQLPEDFYQRATMTGGSLIVVAHQDDDLLFINPDVNKAIQSGKPVRTVYLTAGDGGLSREYWQARESGAEAAYAQMAGVNNNWITVPYTFNSKNIRVRYLLERPAINLMFLRLPDGLAYGNGSTSYGSVSLEKLWKGSISSISSVDGAHSLTREDVIDLLAQLMTKMEADSINALDSSKEVFSEADMRSGYTHDHSDHVFSGYFAFVAQSKYRLPHSYRYYVGYSSAEHPENMSANEFAAKFATATEYTPFDSETCGSSCVESDPVGVYSKRKISTVAVNGSLKGRISVYANGCLQPVGGASAEGTPIEIAVCNMNAEQQWELTTRGEIIGLGNRCLQIRGRALDGVVEMATCDQSESQRWTLMSSAQLRSANNNCLEVRDGATAAGSPVQVSNCNGMDQQAMAFIFSGIAAKTLGVEFSDSDIGSNQNSADSFRFADLNRDSKPDACIVKIDGVYCALMNADGLFANYTKLSSSVVNDAPEYSATIMYGDINGDKRDDFCVRGPVGISCAEINSDATAFENFGLRSANGDFSDAGGWNSSNVFYQSIRLADINGDGKADVCGRGQSGIVCALNNGNGMFGAATEWLSSSVAEAGEWLNTAFAASTQLADINGDGRYDICFLANKGLYCAFAKSAGEGFEYYHRASHQMDMVAGWQTSPTYYRSIRFPDVNGDGVTDLCARSMNGIICGLGLGDGYFDIARSITLRHDFNNAVGWYNNLYAQSIHFADINGDKHMDVCGRGTYQILCAVAP